ncbi:MAG TPA: hypothetical protein VIT38_01390 [Allosphingosinicella sp.]|jgi:hypothetical protein
MSVTRLFQFLTIAAVLLMPLGMSGGRAMAAQQAAPAAATMDHCNSDADKTAPHRSMPDADCTAACAAIPELGDTVIAAPMPFPAPIEPSPVVPLGKGLGPEAAIPPPRIS